MFEPLTSSGENDEGDLEEMLRKFKGLSLMFGLILLVLPISGCIRGDAGLEAALIAGRVVLAEDQASGVVGVSLLIVDGTTTYLETDEEGYFQTAAFSETVIIPRKTGYRFVPESQVVGEARELEFAAYPWAEPDFANWGLQFSFASHLDRVDAVAFSQDDQYLATGSNDRTIRIWRTADGQLVRTMAGHTSAVNVVEFSPQGHYLASGGGDGRVKVWDWQTGREVKTLPGHSHPVSDIAWSPDGTKLASSGWDSTVRIWDSASGAELEVFTHEKWVRTVAWSPDGKFLLSGGDELKLRVWRVELGELSAEFDLRERVMVLSPAPKGSLAAVSLESGALKILNFATGEEVLLGHAKGGAAALSWSHDGRYLAAGSDKVIQVWDAEEGRLVQSIDAGNEVLALDWARSSYLLASGSYRGIIGLWSADSGENLLRITGHTRAVRALAWSPQGDSLASGDEVGIIRLWDLQAREQKYQLPGHNSKPVEDLAWSPDGKYLASGGHDFLVRLWNPAEGEQLAAFTERIKKPFVHEKGFEFAVGMTNVSHEDIVLSLSWAPNGKRLASASWDKTVAIWDVPAGTQLVGMKNLGWITAVAWSPQGEQVAFGGHDQAVHLHSPTGKELQKLQGHTNWVRSLAWSPDGRQLASSGYDQQLFVWDVEAGQILRTLNGHDNVITVVEWSPCGRYLAGGSHSGTVYIWDISTGDIVYTYPGRVLGLQSLAWSPTGHQLAISEYNAILILGEPF